MIKLNLDIQFLDVAISSSFGYIDDKTKLSSFQ